MIDVSVGENDRIDLFRRKGERTAVESLERA